MQGGDGRRVLAEAGEQHLHERVDDHRKGQHHLSLRQPSDQGRQQQWGRKLKGAPGPVDTSRELERQLREGP